MNAVDIQNNHQAIEHCLTHRSGSERKRPNEKCSLSVARGLRKNIGGSGSATTTTTTCTIRYGCLCVRAVVRKMSGAKILSTRTQHDSLLVENVNSREHFRYRSPHTTTSTDSSEEEGKHWYMCEHVIRACTTCTEYGPEFFLFLVSTKS